MQRIRRPLPTVVFSPTTHECTTRVRPTSSSLSLPTNDCYYLLVITHILYTFVTHSNSLAVSSYYKYTRVRESSLLDHGPYRSASSYICIFAYIIIYNIYYDHTAYCMAFTRHRRALGNWLKSNLSETCTWKCINTYIIISSHNETQFVKIT